MPARLCIRPLVLALALTGLVSGCAQGPLTSRRTTIGALKANVAQLESEKEQLRHSVAELKSENHRIEDRLVQEEAVNGELYARLDDARNLISRQGFNTEGLAGPTRSDLELGLDRSRRLSPSRVQGKPRRSPVAEVRGRPSLDPPEPEDSDPPGTSLRDDDLRPQARRSGGALWLPVDPGLSQPSTRLR
jgi:hypothetical protein